jgi:hypothetical protein
MGPPVSGSITTTARTRGRGAINFQSLNHNYFLTYFRKSDFMSAPNRGGDNSHIGTRKFYPILTPLFECKVTGELSSPQE